MHSQLIANSNVMQIFVKSPPSNDSVPKTDDSSKEHPLFPNPDPNVSNKFLLEAREAHILKLNKQNVKLQEENDNLINELEKIKFENNEKIQMLQKNFGELNSKNDQTSIDKEHLKKVCNDLQKELIELKNTFKEKDQQVEQLTQEGLKLSKQELNQSNIIKKLRAKEKENEESLTSLR
jgi:predicted RNase H-like nuclease (RuvC/YqgF family)